MGISSFAAADTASAILALSKAAWKLGSSLSKLDQDTPVVNATVKNLMDEVRSLGDICDLVCAELEEAVTKNRLDTPPSHDVGSRILICLATQVEETSTTIQELEQFVRMVRGEELGIVGQAQRQRKLDKSKDQLLNINTRIRRQTTNLRIVLLLFNIISAHIAPCVAHQGLAKDLDLLQDMIDKLQTSSETYPQSQPSFIEANLLQCAHEVIVNGASMYEATVAAGSIARGQGAADDNIRVAQWVSTLESMRRDQRFPDPSDIVSNSPSIFSGDEVHTIVTSVSSAQRVVPERDTLDGVDDFDDDLDIDLAKAALDTGTKAFEEKDWNEADSFFKEALRMLQQLPKQQRAFCDIFGLQYKLAVCAYHTQEPTVAEEALMSLIQQSVSSDKQRGYVYDAAHLLSHLYIRMGQVDRARSECEKALQARRRLTGKQSDASLESIALMSHIYLLLNNRARARSYLAIIPESRRDTILRNVTESLGLKVEHFGSPLLLTRSVSDDSELSAKPVENDSSAISLPQPVGDRCYGPVTARISQSLAAYPRQCDLRLPLHRLNAEDLRSITVTSLSSAEERRDSTATGNDGAGRNYIGPEALSTTSLRPGELPETNEISESASLSRKEILDRVGCQPRDRIEEAVCNGEQSTLSSLLNKNRGFWRSKLRKQVRPERVTALHYAAIFGEIDMARRLLGSGFNINEVPYGYSTSLTPLKFAVGARQAYMVKFLIANGAKPLQSESWSTLAGQLMNRAWLKKTMSEADKENTPNQMTAILKILLEHRWEVNLPYETSGSTVLHQAVAFWTGSYKWDLGVRATMTSFLCECGADPLQENKEGKTPYDMASTSGHQEVLGILDRRLGRTKPDDGSWERVELPGELMSKT